MKGRHRPRSRCTWTCFCAVADAIEQADADDSRWLDAALQVLEKAAAPAAFDLRDVLVAIDQDHVLRPIEHRRIRAAIASIPERAEFARSRLDYTRIGRARYVHP